MRLFFGPANVSYTQFLLNVCPSAQIRWTHTYIFAATYWLSFYVFQYLNNLFLTLRVACFFRKFPGRWPKANELSWWSRKAWPESGLALLKMDSVEGSKYTSAKKGFNWGLKATKRCMTWVWLMFFWWN